MSIGQKIQIARKKKGISQEEFANLLNVSRQAVQKWESNTSSPETNKLSQISKILNISLDYLLNDETAGENHKDKKEEKQSSPVNQSGSLNEQRIDTIKVWLIIGCVLSPLALGGSILKATGTVAFTALLLYAFSIPMCIGSIRCMRKAKNKSDIIGWGVLSLIFVSFIGGLLMLVTKDEHFEPSKGLAKAETNQDNQVKTVKIKDTKQNKLNHSINKGLKRLEKIKTPTKITFSRIILVVVMLITLVALDIIGSVNGALITPLRTTLGNSHINVTALGICIIFIIVSLTDILDGYLARKNNHVTDLGKFLGQLTEKLLINSLLIFLCFRHSYIKNGYTINYWFVLLMIMRDIIVDALRFIAANKKVVIAANKFGKAKTVAQMITIPLVLLNGWPFTYFDYYNQWPKELRIVSFFVYITTILSVLSGVIYVIQNRKVLTNGSEETSKPSK